MFGLIPIVFLICVALIIIVFVGKKSKKPIEVKNAKQDINNEKNDIEAYKLYSDWCKRKNEMPITKEEFERLANAQGSINLADVMDRHCNINPYRQEEDLDETKNNVVNEYEERLQKEKDEQKKRDEKFVTSAIAGYIANSTTKGILIGGSSLGGLFGDYLNKKLKK